MTMSDPMSDVEALAWVRQPGIRARAAHIRRSARLSQEEVAEAVGASRATVAAWEVGTRQPRGPSGVRYAMLLQRLGGLVGEGDAPSP